MNKKFLGIKISTYLTVLCCFFAAVLLWLYVKYSEDNSFNPQDVVAFIRGSKWV